MNNISLFVKRFFLAAMRQCKVVLNNKLEYARQWTILTQMQQFSVSSKHSRQPSEICGEKLWAFVREQPDDD